jgi:hypothetical protein
MGRAIVSEPRMSAMAAIDHAPSAPDSYKDRLFKYIPGEVVALYVALNTIVIAAPGASRLWPWAIFAIGFVATPIYLNKAQKVTSAAQLAISTIAFIVWILALGGPFKQFAFFNTIDGELLASILLPVYTFFVALYDPPPRT